MATYFFDLTGLLFLLGGIGACVMSQGAVHEIGGLLSILIAIVCFGVSSILSAMDKLSKAPAKTARDT